MGEAEGELDGLLVQRDPCKGGRRTILRLVEI